jgi:hypothetical protein
LGAIERSKKGATMRISAIWLAGLTLGLMSSSASGADSTTQHVTRGARLTADYPSCSGKPSRVTSNSGSEDVACAIRQTIYNMRDTRDDYEFEIRRYQKKQAFFDSSIIGLGVASVEAALTKSPTVALGTIGVVAAGLGQYRGYYNPEGTGAAYIKAVAAARCVASSAEPLLSARPQPYWNAMFALRQAIANYDSAAGALNAAPPPAAGTPAAQAAGSAADAGQKARDAAVQVLQALNTESDAFNSAPAVIDQAHDAILNFMDQAKHRSGVNFSSVTSALDSAVDAEKTSAAANKTATTEVASADVAQTKAQATAGVQVNQPAPTVTAATQPQSLNAADSTPPPQTVPGATPLVQNLAAISALVNATKDAQIQASGTPFTTASRKVTTCATSLSSAS